MSDEQTTTAEHDPKCEGCAPDPVVTGAVTPDPAWDIPEFLDRKLHPELNRAPTDTAATSYGHAPVAERGDYGIDRHREYETDRDRAERRRMLDAEYERVKGTKEEKKVQRSAEKQAEHDRLHANKMQAREVFVQHFKWDWEK